MLEQRSSPTLFRLGSSVANARAQAERTARWVRLVRATIAVMVVLAVGTYGYWYLSEGRHSLVEALYMTVISISTVGFNEVIPIDSDGMRLFTMGLIFFGGASVVYFLAAVAAFVVEGDFLYGFWRRRLRKELSRVDGHVVVCGLGRVGQHAFSDLFASRVTVVGVDREEARIESLLAAHGPDILFMIADAFDEPTLRGVRIDRAHALVAALADDRDNFLLCVTARQMNPSIRLVVRLVDPAYAEMFADVRAEAVVHPPAISGVRMANELTRPELTSFTRRLLAGDAHTRELGEVVVPPGASVVGHTLGSLEIRRRTQAMVVGMRRQHAATFTFRPPAEGVVVEGDVLLVHAKRAERKAVQALLAGTLPAPPPRPMHTEILPLYKDLARLGGPRPADAGAAAPTEAGPGGALAVDHARAPLEDEEPSTRRGHVVVIGAGAVGRAVARELVRQGVEVVVVDRSAQHLAMLPSEAKLTTRQGDITERATLAELDLPTARGVVTALQPLRDNLFLAAVVHHMNPRARVVARVGNIAEGSRLRAVGAAITNPGEIGGVHLAHLAIHPELAEFADGLEASLDRPEQLAIVPITQASVAKKTLGELELQRLTGCVVLGIRDREGAAFVFHPTADARAKVGGSLVVLGEPGQLAALKALV
ncbi:MAG: NAD-binding protein [Myxococcota bacterium]